MAKDYFHVSYSNLMDDFNIHPSKCSCMFKKNHSYSVNTTSVFDETTKKNRITSLKVVCNICFMSSYFYIKKSKKIYEEDLNYV